MDKYIYQVDTRLDGRFYCRIYQFGIPDALASTDDYDDQDDAIQAAETLIQEYQAMTGEK
jgi:hypothetical protein